MARVSRARLAEMLERTKSADRVDQDAQWKVAGSQALPVDGRWRAEVVFDSAGGPRIVVFWLRCAGDPTNDLFLACREIINSRRDPAEFEGQELPTRKETVQ